MKLLLTCLLALSCSPSIHIPEIKDRGPADAHIPKISQFDAHDPYFRYDVEYAREIYGNPNLRFWNLDPNDSAKSKYYTGALGAFIVHTTFDLSSPMWARALMYSYNTPYENLVEYGMLPTPFRHQLQAVPKKAPPVALSLQEAHYVKDDVSYTVWNCFICHAGISGDDVIAGGTNKNADVIAGSYRFREFINLRKRVRDTIGDTLLRPATMAYQWWRLGDFNYLTDTETRIMDAVDRGDVVTEFVINKAYETPRGGNTATMGVWMSWASLKENGKSFDDIETELLKSGVPTKNMAKLMELTKTVLNGVLPTTAPRPWWLARYSDHHFWFNVTEQGIESGDELALALTTPSTGNPHYPLFNKRYKISRYIQQYITEIQSPPYPQPINEKMAKRGKIVYDNTCATCHGKLDQHEDDTYTLTYDHKKAKVDAIPFGVDLGHVYLYQMSSFVRQIANDNEDAKRYGTKFLGPWDGEEPWVMAPPLIGTWASSPYLHNGSVPTLYQVLNPDARPRIWKQDVNPYAYDYLRVGTAHRVLDDAPLKLQTIDQRRYYDTTKMWQSNSGHLVGRTMTERQRWDVIEFLKTLTTENVKPNPINSIWE